MQQPTTTECRSYFFKYINLVAEGDIIDILLQQADETREFFNNIPADRHDYRYAEDKWSVKQVLMHIIDTERVMNYRALVAARGDTDTKLYNMDENLYADTASYAGRTMQDILEEFSAVRTATVKLFANVNPAQSEQPAYNLDGSHFTTRALAYIIAGHLLHHLNIIKERYL